MQDSDSAEGAEGKGCDIEDHHAKEDQEHEARQATDGEIMDASGEDSAQSVECKMEEEPEALGGDEQHDGGSDTD